MRTDPIDIEDWQSLEYHPMCLAFPEMTPDEFEALRLDIMGQGVEHPIIICEGQILDGRHRHKVCLELGFEPRFEEFKGPGSPYDYVISMNLKRRSLTTAQKIDVLDKLVELNTQRAKERQQQSPGRPKKGLANLPKPESNVIPLHTHVELAKAVDISPRTAQDALTIKSKGTPDDWQEVHQGKASISGKAKEVRERTKPKAPNLITLPTWGNLTSGERQAALATTCKGNLNKQENESIGWAKYSWNPVTGCLHNCPYCYARDIATRFYGEVGFAPAIYPDRLTAPLYHSPKQSSSPAERNIFTCSMADLFGKWVPEEWIEAVFNTITQAPQWNFLMLTKFPRRMIERDVPPNVWLGASVDSQARVKATEEAFANVKAGTRWLSLEPLLEPLTFSRPDLFDWVVIGGASPSARTPAWTPPLEWLVSLSRQFNGRVYFKENALPRQFPWDTAPIAHTPSKAFFSRVET